jgi:hypothetical protein
MEHPPLPKMLLRGELQRQFAVRHLRSRAVSLPLLLYPTPYTLWQAVDILMREVKLTDFVAMSDDDSATSESVVAFD